MFGGHVISFQKTFSSFSFSRWLSQTSKCVPKLHFQWFSAHSLSPDTATPFVSRWCTRPTLLSGHLYAHHPPALSCPPLRLTRHRQEGVRQMCLCLTIFMPTSSTLYVQCVGPARNRPRRLFVLLRFLSNQPLAILSRSCSQISSTDERNSESRDFFLSLCVYQVIKTWNPQVKTRASQATG